LAFSKRDRIATITINYDRLLLSRFIFIITFILKALLFVFKSDKIHSRCANEKNWQAM